MNKQFQFTLQPHLLFDKHVKPLAHSLDTPQLASKGFRHVLAFYVVIQNKLIFSHTGKSRNQSPGRIVILFFSKCSSQKSEEDYLQQCATF